MPQFETLQAGFLIATRTTAFLFLAPFFSIKGAPNLLKIILGIYLALIILPGVAITGDLPADIGRYSLLIIKEAFVGIVLGLVCMLVFSAIRLAGEIIDLQIGFSMASVLDPQNQTRITLIGQFMYMLGILLFLVIDGHHSLLMALSYSFDLVPIEGAILKPGMSSVAVRTFVGMFLLGVMIAIPFITVLLICDISLGMLARTVPQINVFMLGFPMKVGLGLFTLLLALPILITAISTILKQVEKDLVTVMGYMV